MESADSSGYNLPISIDNLRSMYLRKVNKNDGEYTKSSKNFSNKIVNECENRVWRSRTSEKGIRSGLGTRVLATYEEGYHAHSSESVIFEGKRCVDMIPSMTEEQFTFWFNFFKKSEIEEILKLGTYIIGHTSNALAIEMKRRYQVMRKNVYLRSNDPDDWINDIETKEKLLFTDDKHECVYSEFITEEDYKDVREKISNCLQFGKITPIH